MQVNIDQAVALDLRLEVGQDTESLAVESEAQYRKRLYRPRRAEPRDHGFAA